MFESEIVETKVAVPTKTEEFQSEDNQPISKNSKKPKQSNNSPSTAIAKKTATLQHQDSIVSDTTGSPPSDDSDCFTGAPNSRTDISSHLGAKLAAVVVAGEIEIGKCGNAERDDSEWMTVCSGRSLKSRKATLNSVSSSSSSDSKDSGFENDMELLTSVV